ncbi:DUF7091 family protein [Haloplanus halobius]|uniref:DUF7091 family protein n=1 Tax=Haloplanus halobius TaxID=2934938 RepID=UPI00200DA36C|nr:hypothetical protein [Haloplanus sp. XH21]
MDDRLQQFVRTTFRSAGRRYAEARAAYQEGRETGDIPRDDEGRVRIVCRREAERRAVALDSENRPACYEAGHPDCEGCLEDVREGVVETW